MTSLSDEQLIEQVREDASTKAYSELVKRYQSQVYGLAYSLMGDWSEAQDMTQETFLRAYLKLHQLRDTTRFASWLRRITFGTCMDWLKTFRPELYCSMETAEDSDDFVNQVADERASPPEQLQKQELSEIVIDAIATLPPKYRIPIIMFHIEGVRLKQIATFLDKPMGTIQSLINRARKKLKPLLEPYYTQEMSKMVNERLSGEKLTEDFAQQVAQFLDWNYGADGDAALRQFLADGADPNARFGSNSETPLHVATRRRRKTAVTILLDHGADIDAKTVNGKTAYAHAIRRGFTELVDLLASRGASTELNDADKLAVAIINGQLDEARQILAAKPNVARTGNPDEDRLLADVAGRSDTEASVKLLIDAGADLTATALDSGTALHQAAWFGQPANARLLIDAGAPLDVFDTIHESSPLGWAVHGSRYSGGAEGWKSVYVELVEMLLDAGSSLHYSDQPDSDAYLVRLLKDATPEVEQVLRRATAAESLVIT